MTEPLSDTWKSREQPVLREVVEELDQYRSSRVSLDSVAEATGLSIEEVHRAALNLERGGYVELELDFGSDPAFKNFTERALRATGMWPDDEKLADAFLWTLERKVDEANTPEERSRAAKVRDAIVSAGRDFTIELAAAMASRGMGA
jgi:hypothetical protein